MRKFVVVAFAFAVSLSAVSPALARGGCGEGWHRGPRGACLRNGGEVVVVGPARGPAVVLERGRACPFGYHLGPRGHCRPN